jgi:2-polyprenyl-6-methoxyphenol hydroxylase-like FAD-dependent oxidoreductase
MECCRETRLTNFDRLGYAPGIFDRQKFLQSLYNQLKHKEDTHVNKSVKTIYEQEDSVRVECADGSSYTGAIVVGADGIHSKVRREMQRLAPRTRIKRQGKYNSRICLYLRLLKTHPRAQGRRHAHRIRHQSLIPAIHGQGPSTAMVLHLEDGPEILWG